MSEKSQIDRAVKIQVKSITLDGDLRIPQEAEGIVLFAHGSGSSRHSPRNRFVAEELQRAGLATLLIDLLTTEEEEIDERTRELRFDIGLLAGRLVKVLDWLAVEESTRRLNTGLFGASTGAAAALVAASERNETVKAVVSRGGRPDLAMPILPKVAAPTLLIVGGEDLAVLEMNQAALRELRAVKELQIVAEASHLFEEPGALEEVARLAHRWFLKFLSSEAAANSRTA